jgi:murein L,D-transpeptidase YafK
MKNYFLVMCYTSICALTLGFVQAPVWAQSPNFKPSDQSFGQSSADALPKADLIVVYKRSQRMFLLQEGQILRQYRVAFGKNPVGHKVQMGDNRTPEGRYTIDMRNEKSAYFRSLRISYPNSTDIATADAIGVDPGNWLMIHGLPNGRSAASVGHPQKNWTRGCIAVDNDEMQELWQMVDVGTPINIKP